MKKKKTKLSLKLNKNSSIVFMYWLLTVSSYQVTCVESGDKALGYLELLDIEENEYETPSLSSSNASKLEMSKINLIITDYSMPGITGYDLLKGVKDSSWKDIPVVVMSSENVPPRINKRSRRVLAETSDIIRFKQTSFPILNSITHHHLSRDENNQDQEDDEDVVSPTLVRTRGRRYHQNPQREGRESKNCMFPENITHVSVS